MDRQLHITQSAVEPRSFLPPLGKGAYSLLLITLESVSREEKNRIATEIIASGARYIAAGASIARTGTTRWTKLTS